MSKVMKDPKSICNPLSKWITVKWMLWWQREKIYYLNFHSINRTRKSTKNIRSKFLHLWINMKRYIMKEISGFQERRFANISIGWIWCYTSKHSTAGCIGYSCEYRFKSNKLIQIIAIPFINNWFLLVQLHIELSVCTNNDTIIKALIIFSEGIFEGETLIAYSYSRPTSRIVLPFITPKNIVYDIHLKVRNCSTDVNAVKSLIRISCFFPFRS